MRRIEVATKREHGWPRARETTSKSSFVESGALDVIKRGDVLRSHRLGHVVDKGPRDELPIFGVEAGNESAEIRPLGDSTAQLHDVAQENT